MSDWVTVSLNEIAFINPTEKLAKGTLATKIGMDNLQPFSKKVSAQIQENYNGGMKFRNGDTIVARITPCLENGKTAYIDTLKDGEIGFGSTEYIVLRAKVGLSNSHFLYYFARSDTFRDVAIASMTGSSGRQRVQTEVVVNHTFELPTLPEQKAIASVLSSLDDKIDLLHRQNKTLEAMAETLFRQWFIEEANEDWEEVTLADVCTRITDGSHSSPASVEDGYPMASVKDMYDWGINQSTCRKISKEDYEVLVQADCKALQGDILIAKDGSYLKHVFLMEESLDVVLLSSIAMLRPNGQYHPMLLTLFLKLDSTHELMQNIVTGAVIPRIVLKDFRKFPIQLPPKDLQDKAVKIIKPIFEKCWENNRQIQTLENLRDSLLPKLMSGEIRVQYQTEEVA
ncbi:restriction endonuclease subunit S [Acinetobacter baumannii]|uniref:restriction endonuclease subunit S n=1 Tax=Acinetobacter baumannii TaxID=470 RepID=UPI003D7FB47B